MNKFFVPVLKEDVHLVPRQQLRRTEHGRTLFVPRHLQSLAATIPAPPQTFSGSKNRSTKYPILGNNQVGNCFYCSSAHQAQTWCGWTGKDASFDVKALIQRYRELSHGDNGLSDDQIFPEWRGGIVGPNGSHKILDEMTVDPRDRQAVRLGISEFCGATYTASLLEGWLRNPQPGQVWDANMGRPNPEAGHAMHLSGYTPDGYEDETWGFDPAIRLTNAGLEASDPEVTIQFSLDMFDSRGIAPHNGKTYDELAQLWRALGGETLPASPFTGGNNPPAPTPPVPTPAPAAFNWQWLLATVELWLKQLGPLAIPLIEQLVRQLPLPPLAIKLIEQVIEEILGMKYHLKVA